MENKKLIGKIYPTKSWGDLEIIDYLGNREVYVRFVNTGYVTRTHLTSITSGCVRDRLLPSVYGVGIVGDSPIVDNEGIKLKEYGIWCSMLARCYSKIKHAEFPSYSDCEVSENFKYFPYFKEWCKKQIGFGNEGWHLDKDILVKGNKIYSEDTCCFVPYQINVALTKCTRSRGVSLIGTCRQKGSKTFMSCVNIGGELKYLGRFHTEIEAFNSYKVAKEDYIKSLALTYKDVISPMVYKSLMGYCVETSD